jgi:hypothetical protein
LRLLNVVLHLRDGFLIHIRDGLGHDLGGLLVLVVVLGRVLPRVPRAHAVDLRLICGFGNGLNLLNLRLRFRDGFVLSLDLVGVRDRLLEVLGSALLGNRGFFNGSRNVLDDRFGSGLNWFRSSLNWFWLRFWLRDGLHRLGGFLNDGFLFDDVLNWLRLLNGSLRFLWFFDDLIGVVVLGGGVDGGSWGRGLEKDKCLMEILSRVITRLI